MIGLTATFDPYDDGYDGCDGSFAIYRPYIKIKKGRERMSKRKARNTVLGENEREEVTTI